MKRLVRGVAGLDAVRLVADAKSLSVRKQVAAHAAEAIRRDVPGTPWFFVKVGDDATPVGLDARTGDSSPASPRTGMVLGNPEAKVRMLQFEDIQCPVCKVYNDDALPAIVDEYVRPVKVKLDFRGLAFLGPDR